MADFNPSAPQIESKCALFLDKPTVCAATLEIDVNGKIYDLQKFPEIEANSATQSIGENSVGQYEITELNPQDKKIIVAGLDDRW